MNQVINVKLDSIIMFDKELKLPIKLEDIKEVLGQGVDKELESGIKIYVWEQYGIYIWLNKDIATGFRVNLNVTNFKLCNANFRGQMLINDEDYSNIKWKTDKYNIGKECKIGLFNLFLEDEIISKILNKTENAKKYIEKNSMNDDEFEKLLYYNVTRGRN